MLNIIGHLLILLVVGCIVLVFYFGIVFYWLKWENVKASFKQAWFLATLGIALVFPFVIWVMAYEAYIDDGKIFGQNCLVVLVDAVAFIGLLTWYIIHQYKEDGVVKEVFSRKFWKPS